MKNLENFGVQELESKEIMNIEGGNGDDNYNQVLGVLLWPFYQIGYVLGRI
ncbi:hypothetical protein ACQY1Q_05795 [Tenacibaculum sp. TC6]|uniref:hypothetical protein n=1 Tax=Tenacibaculum sp. TC6 TaxID=3423223 RepID=UPI003D35AC23